MGWILRRAKASKKAKAERMLMAAETPMSTRVAIAETTIQEREREREKRWGVKEEEEEN